MTESYYDVHSDWYDPYIDALSTVVSSLDKFLNNDMFNTLCDATTFDLGDEQYVVPAELDAMFDKAVARLEQAQDQLRAIQTTWHEMQDLPSSGT